MSFVPFDIISGIHIHQMFSDEISLSLLLIILFTFPEIYLEAVKSVTCSQWPCIG